jgi:hypothetical protein
MQNVERSAEDKSEDGRQEQWNAAISPSEWAKAYVVNL